MKNYSMESGERGQRDHSKGEGNKADRQGGGPGERSSMAGEQGAKVEETDNSTRSHTQAGEVRGHGTLKDGSSNDQTAEERGTGLHLGDDYRIDKITGEQNENVRRQTGSANHEGGDANGAGGGKSSGGAGHGPQGNAKDASGQASNDSKNQSNASGNGGSGNKNPEKGKTGGDHQHGGEFPPRTRQDPNQEGSSAGSH